MTPTISPSRNPTTVHGVYSRESVYPDASPMRALSRRRGYLFATCGAATRMLAGAAGASRTRTGPACADSARPTRPAAPTLILHRGLASANGPGRSGVGAYPVHGRSIGTTYKDARPIARGERLYGQLA